MDLSPIANNLEALSASEVLKQVIGHNVGEVDSGESASLVEVRVVIGQVSATGHPIKIDSKKNLVMLSGVGVVYLNVNDLELIEVLNPNVMVADLSASPPSAAKVVAPASPPRQELRAQLAALNSKVERRFSFEIEADVLDDSALTDKGKNQFGTFLGLVESAFDAIGAEDVGEITLSSLDRVAIVLGKELAVKRSGSVMVIAVPFNAEFPGTLSAQLDTMFEANL